jgi:hypothetical protein
MKLKMAALVVVLLFACDKATSTSTSAAGSAATGSATGEDDDPEQAAGAAQSWKVGDVVQIKRDDKKWYEAEIVGVGSTYNVMYTFAENVEDNVDPARIRKTRWAKKNHVEAQVGDAWKHGTVVARHGSGDYSYDIALDGGGTQTFTAAQVRGLRKPKTATTAASSNASAPCPAPAYIMRCGGSCIDTHQDFNNCGSCGHRCMAGGRCDEGFCRDKQGDH